jgi:O-6-methylguanine DNA methyltransferase
MVESVNLGIGLVEGFAIFDSALGPVGVAFNPSGVSSVDLVDDDFERRFAGRFHRPVVKARPPVGWDAKISRALEQGRPGSLPIDLRSVTPFRRAILEIAATIPRGEVRPYQWLARQVGKPGTARAVGSAMAQNPIPLIVPCHRVVRSDGLIGEYSLGGAPNKWRLLIVEGADPADLQTMAQEGTRMVGSDSTSIFCYPSCHQARRITTRHQQRFHSASDALAAGYRACLTCQPA